MAVDAGSAAIDRLVDGVERTIIEIVRHAQRSPGFRQRTTTILYRRRHEIETRTVEAIDRFSGRMAAHMSLNDSRTFRSLVDFACQSAELRAAVTGREGTSDELTARILEEHLAELAERYFERRPMQRGVSRQLAATLAADFRAYLTATTSRVAAIVPIPGLNGTFRAIALDDRLTLRQLSVAEKKGLYARHQDEHAMSGWFNRGSLTWTYCIEAIQDAPGKVRPSVKELGPPLSDALSALRIITDERLDMPIMWVRPIRGTFIGPSDHIMPLDHRGAEGRPARLTHGGARDVVRLYRRLVAAPPSVPFRIALSRYNSAVERDWYVDLLIDLWVGLDALYAPDRASSYRMNLRAARFLGRSATERTDLFDMLRRSYGARSDVVHGHQTAEDVPALCERTELALKNSILGCRTQFETTTISRSTRRLSRDRASLRHERDASPLQRHTDMGLFTSTFGRWRDGTQRSGQLRPIG